MIEPGRSDEDLAWIAGGSPDTPEGRQAASLLLGRWAKPVYRWCYGYVRDPETAEDLAQDVLMRAYAHMREFEGWGRFSAWLFIICRNLCLDAVRKRARERREDTDVDALADPAARPDGTDQAEDDELWRTMNEVLTGQERDALLLRCYQQMPVDLITTALGIEGRSGARGVLQSARRKLRRALGRRMPPALAGGDAEDGSDP